MRRGGRKSSRRWSRCSATCASASWTGNRCSARVNEVIAELKASPPPLPVDEVAEALQFLEWLAGDNFTFLGFRSYVFPDREHHLEPQWETGLGILRAAEVRVLRRGSELVSMTPEIMAFLNEPKALIITKANVRARIHRHVHMDYVGVKHFDAAGTLIGEYRFVGLFTSPAYMRSTRSIPLSAAQGRPPCFSRAGI